MAKLRSPVEQIRTKFHQLEVESHGSETQLIVDFLYVISSLITFRAVVFIHRSAGKYRPSIR